jgi:S1-C subfamily serine protease
VPLSLAFVRRSISLLAGSLALLSAAGAVAQELPFDKVSGAELRQALVWTGHLSLWDDDPLAAVQKATQSWQAAKGYRRTETLSEDQTSELLAEAVKQRHVVGWSILQDKAVGLSVGVPTRLVRLVAPRTINGGMTYDFEGSIGFAIGTRYGDLRCATMESLYARMARDMRPTWKMLQDDRFAMIDKRNGRQTYLQAVCRTSGVVLATVVLADSQVANYGVLFGAVADSLLVSRSFNPTAVPRPKVDDAPPGASDLRTDVVANPAGPAKLPPHVDGDGKSAGVKLKTRDGSDLSAQDVFEKAAGSVYVVKADRRMGSAVAISNSELLTNCHVVGDVTQVTIGRDRKEQNATVVSMNASADRCVLRADGRLASWVGVRPYEDIKVGERAITIGTPQGLELTVAEGIVSSKRTHKGSRLVQTSAPISQGSSGGGLFDAQGQLLGITTFYFTGGQNLNFAVAAEDFAKN